MKWNIEKAKGMEIENFGSNFPDGLKPFRYFGNSSASFYCVFR